MKAINTVIGYTVDNKYTTVFVGEKSTFSFDSRILRDSSNPNNCKFLFPYRDDSKNSILTGELVVSNRYVCNRNNYGQPIDVTLLLDNNDEVLYDVKLYRSEYQAIHHNPLLDENGHEMSVKLNTKDIIYQLEEAEKDAYCHKSSKQIYDKCDTNVVVMNFTDDKYTVITVDDLDRMHTLSTVSPFNSLVVYDFRNPDNYRFLFPYKDDSRNLSFVGDLAVPENRVRGMKDYKLPGTVLLLLDNNDDISYNVKLYSDMDHAVRYEPALGRNGQEIFVNLKREDIVHQLGKADYDAGLSKFINSVTAKGNSMESSDNYQLELEEW